MESSTVKFYHKVLPSTVTAISHCCSLWETYGGDQLTIMFCFAICTFSIITLGHIQQWLLENFVRTTASIWLDKARFHETIICENHGIDLVRQSPYSRDYNLLDCWFSAISNCTLVTPVLRRQMKFRRLLNVSWEALREAHKLNFKVD